MKRYLILVTLALLGIEAAHSQNVISRLKGTPVLAEDVNIQQGTPFLSDKFSKGSFTLSDGKTIADNLQIKVNLMKDGVSYLDEAGKELVPTESINKFTIESEGKVLTFQKGFPAIDKYTSDSYYEVLNKGGVPLILKKRTKTLLSAREYNSSKITDSYLDGVKYFVYTEDGQISKLKTDKSSIAAYFPSKQKEMTDYLVNNKINFKNDADLAKLFEYYISIK